MAFKLPLHQHLRREILYLDIENSQFLFPDLGRNEAFNEYVKQYRIEGVFFLDSNGKRHILGPAIHNYTKPYYEPRDFREMKGGYKKKYDTKSSKVPRLAPELAALVLHKSEQGWNLPIDHRRHFLQLPLGKFLLNLFSKGINEIVPLEIRKAIFEFVLSFPKDCTILPVLVAPNWKIYWAKPRFGFFKDDKYCELATKTSVWIDKEDEHGSYTEHRNVTWMGIDSSCLQVSRSFYREGIDILYSKNSFAFRVPLRNPNFYFHPPTHFAGQAGKWHPRPHKPDLNESSERTISRAILKVDRQLKLARISDWVWADYFLRFLYTISPNNAASLRSLSFAGTTKLHYCSATTCGGNNCTEGLICAMWHYIPFIRKFCTNLKRLTISALMDQFPPPMLLKPGDPANRNEALLPLLENQDGIRSLSTLEELDVLDDKGRTLPIAKPTIGWISDRAKEVVRAESERIERTKIVSNL
ncbi:hypothetical protein EG329_002471 [Mollisiaceae sp. DMI_Dod_QoI]|nr:hypothetical protein EG329_002471 [Helotiales sp. DMI_Dod_QoI]